MRVTHLGHACLLVELADSRILIDPGSYSTDFESLRDLDAVVITHQHADHLDEERLPELLAANRQAAVYADPESADLLSGASTDVVVLVEGDSHRVGTATIRPVGRLHAVNHDGVPRCTNVGVVLRADGEPTLYHPGDAYDGEPGDVDVLGVPLNAPWCKVAESITFVRRVAPRQIIPIHDALLSPTGRRLYLGHVEGYGTASPEDLMVHDLAGGRTANIALD
jgi:L-ascorbate metabolism protein UlaG (beta-lactamase superfamily)